MPYTFSLILSSFTFSGFNPRRRNPTTAEMKRTAQGVGGGRDPKTVKAIKV